MADTTANSAEAPTQFSSEWPDYANEQIFQRNRLPPRSYYIPQTSLLLNGVWDFNYAPTPSHAPGPQFGDKNISTENFSQEPETTWTSINVPGHWQLQGHGKPQYTNVIYPFPVCPPNVPTDNPTGTYRRFFQVPGSWTNYHIFD